jgi:hypothetical protein
MSNRISIFALFSVLSGVLVFGIWSNISVYAQQSSSSATPLLPTPPSRTTTVSPEVKAVMCAPGSPSLKIVNTTEARICGIPKTVKSNTTTAAAIPSTSNRSPPTTTTKLQATDVATPKQQKIIATPTASQLPKQTTGASKETTTTAAVSNKPSLPSSPSTIAPQVNAISKKHQQQEQLQPATGNVPAGRNYTFATTSTAVTPNTLKYLGNQGSASAVNGGSSSDSKDKHDSDTKSSSLSGHNDNNGKSSALSIINDISSVIKKSFNHKLSRHSGSSDVVSYFNDNSFDDKFPFTASASSSAIAGGGSASASASAGGG